MPYGSIVNYIFEAGELKRVKRSGWWTAKVKDPETVAEHSFRTGIVAFFLAKLEGADPHKLCTAAVFHDMHETRILDLHKIAARYIDQESAALKAEKEQLVALPPALSAEVRPLFELNETEKAILKDADLLEMCFQAKEYTETGYVHCENWIKNSKGKLKSRSARALLEKLQEMSSKDWWQQLKKSTSAF